MEQFALNFESTYYVSRPLFSHFLKKGSGRGSALRETVLKVYNKA